MEMPSITECGSKSTRSRSLNVPGSASSQLIQRYRGLPSASGKNDHFIPQGKPAPPRPLNSASLIVETMSAGCIRSAFLSISYPPRSTYSEYETSFLSSRLAGMFLMRYCLSIGCVLLMNDHFINCGSTKGDVSIMSFFSRSIYFFNANI